MSARGLGDIIVSSRPYDEYLAMFGLAERDVLAGPVLDCPGGTAVSVDPAYEMPPDQLVTEVRAGLARGLRALRELLRVAAEEVRLYPPIDTAFARHPAIDDLRARLESGGVGSEILRPGYEFQRDAREVLVLWPAGSPSSRTG